MTIPPNKKQCIECDTIIDAGAAICMSCRANQPVSIMGSANDLVVHGRRSKTTAGLLAIFLGGVGAHKFYLGQMTNGILYVVFCWTLIPALLGLIDGFIILAMTPERFAQRFG